MRAVPPATYISRSLVCRWDARCKLPLPRYKSFGKERGDRQEATRAVGASSYRFPFHVAREPRLALWFFDPFGGRGARTILLGRHDVGARIRFRVRYRPLII